jgi:hypothetical protein
VTPDHPKVNAEREVQNGHAVGARAVPAGELWLLALGFCIWGGALVIAYSLHSAGCAFGWSTGTLRLSLGLAILMPLALTGGCGAITRRPLRTRRSDRPARSYTGSSYGPWLQPS